MAQYLTASVLRHIYSYLDTRDQETFKRELVSIQEYSISDLFYTTKLPVWYIVANFTSLLNLDDSHVYRRRSRFMRWLLRRSNSQNHPFLHSGLHCVVLEKSSSRISPYESPLFLPLNSVYTLSYKSISKTKHALLSCGSNATVDVFWPDPSSPSGYKRMPLIGQIGGRVTGMSAVRCSNESVCGMCRSVRFWKVSKNGGGNDRSVVYDGHDHEVSVVTCRDRGSLVLCGSLDRTIHLIKVRQNIDGTLNPMLLCKIEKHERGVIDAKFSGCDGIVTASFDGMIKIWRFHDVPLAWNVQHLSDICEFHDGELRKLECVPPGCTYLGVVSAPNNVVVAIGGFMDMRSERMMGRIIWIDVNRGIMIRHVRVNSCIVNVACTSSYTACGTSGGSILVFRNDNGRMTTVSGIPERGWWCSAIAAVQGSDDLFAAASHHGHIYLINHVKCRRKITTIESRFERQIACGCFNGNILLTTAMFVQ